MICLIFFLTDVEHDRNLCSTTFLTEYLNHMSTMFLYKSFTIKLQSGEEDIQTSLPHLPSRQNIRDTSRGIRQTNIHGTQRRLERLPG